MGIYFNPDNIGFRMDTQNEIYVDKTGLLEILNRRIGTSSNCIAVSHARRFGKSQAAGMIDAYYSRGTDSADLFSGLKISRSADFSRHLNRYNVIHLDISSFTDFYRDNLIAKLTEYLYDEFRAVYPGLDYSKKLNAVLSTIAVESGARFVIIIDEWDCVIRNMSDAPELVHEYLQLLHSLFKSEEARSFLALGYITGILPIKKVTDESALNNFQEYTMLESDELTPYFGFTQDEVKQLCTEYQMDFESVRKWYDGYKISGEEIYNPNSVCSAMLRHRLDSYWKNTSAFGTINTYITMNYDGLKDDVLTMLSGGRVRVNAKKFQNDLSIINSKDDVLTALIHLGYLAYTDGKAYIPNYEVAKLFSAALKGG